MTAHFYMVDLDAEQVESVRRLRAAQDAMRPDRVTDENRAAVIKEMDRARLRFALDLGDALLYAIRAGAKS